MPVPVRNRSVDNVELFFDLAFVVIIMQLTNLLHGDPGPQDFLTVIGLLLLVWAAWLNVTTFANLGGVSSNERRIPVLVSMAGVALIAISIPDATGRSAGLFAIGYAIARLAMWPLWLDVVRKQGGRAIRPTIYGPVLASLWLLSIAVPTPARLWCWGVLVTVEMVILLGGFSHSRLSPGHLVERVGLFTMIVLGESLAEVILAVRVDQSFETWLVAGLGFIMIAALWWMYFQRGRAATASVLENGSLALVRDVLGIAHYLVILGLVGVAAGLGGAIERADESGLPVSILIALCGGSAIYGGAQVLIVWRYGLPLRAAAIWGIVTVVVALIVIAIGAGVPPWVSVAIIVSDTVARTLLGPTMSGSLVAGELSRPD